MTSREINETYDQLNESLSRAPESFQRFIKQHDDFIQFLTLRDVWHLIDMMELSNRQDLEFLQLTEKGKIQIEAHEKVYNCLRDSIMKEMKKLQADMEEIGHIDFDDIIKEK